MLTFNVVPAKAGTQPSLLSAVWILFLFISLTPSSSLSNDFDLQLTQTGPGITGALAPLTPNTPIMLTSEDATIYLKEDYAQVESVYYLLNPTKQNVNVTAGIPSIQIQDQDLSIAIKSVSINKKPTRLKVKQIPLEGKFAFKDYLPFVQQFGLQRKWRTLDLRFSPNENKSIRLVYDVPYLYKQERLKGQLQETGKAFQYIRSYAAGWANVVNRSIIYIRPRLSQQKNLNLSPSIHDAGPGVYTYQFDRQEPSKASDITIVYDPIEFKSNIKDQSFKNMFDDNLSTAWCESEPGDGKGKRFSIEWGKLKKIQKLEIFPGGGSSKKKYKESNRPRHMLVYLGKLGWVSKPHKVSFIDSPSFQIVNLPSRDEATMMIFEFDQVYYGSSSNKTCIAEVSLQFSDTKTR